MSKKKLIFGVGVNDAGYVVRKSVYLDEWYSSGTRKQKQVWFCPFYMRWRDMLQRCYDKNFLSKFPTYKECIVCEEWLLFSNFRKWMVTQDWGGKELDKDLLFQGNKEYAPDKCIFISNKVNSFILDKGLGRGDYLLGCSWSSKRRKYRSDIRRCGKTEFLGRFDSEVEAHLTWKERKHEYACQLAESKYVTDERVKEALLAKYKNYTEVEEHLS